MTSSLLFLALLSPALVASLAGLETASLRLNAHLRVQPAHCVYDFYFRPCLTVDLTTLLCVTLSPSNDHHITPQIQLHQICGARRCSIINTPSGRVILHPPFLKKVVRCTGVPLIYIMNWVQVYRDDVIASIFGTPLTGFGRYSRWTRNCVTRA